MNYREINSIPLPDILAQVGKSSVKQTNSDQWFFSPFREEQTPSFKVNTAKNIWYDHGEGRGGRTSDLIKQLYSLSENDHSGLFLKVEEITKGVAVKLQHTSHPAKAKTSERFGALSARARTSSACCSGMPTKIARVS